MHLTYLGPIKYILLGNPTIFPEQTSLLMSDHLSKGSCGEKYQRLGPSRWKMHGTLSNKTCNVHVAAYGKDLESK